MDREQETPASGTNRDEFGKRLVKVLGELFDASARNPQGKELAMLFIAEFGKLGDTFPELRPYIGRIGSKVIGTLIRLLDVWIEPVGPTVNVAISGDADECSEYISPGEHDSVYPATEKVKENFSLES